MTFTTLDPSLTPNVQSNILDNGGMEIWQRGTTFSSFPMVAKTYTADRWYMEVGSGGSIVATVSQNSAVVDTGAYSMKVAITSITSNTMALKQVVESYQAYAGKTVTFSVRINSNSTDLFLVINDGVGTTNSSTLAVTGAFQTLTVTRTLSSSATQLILQINGFSSGETAYIDSAMLVMGTNSAVFVPTNPQVDLARCQRYYFQINSNNTSVIAMMFCTSTTAAQGYAGFPVQMRTSPTTTLTNFAQTEMITATGGGVGVNTLTPSSHPVSCQYNVVVGGSLAAGNASQLVITGGGFILEFSSDL